MQSSPPGLMTFYASWESRTKPLLFITGILADGEDRSHSLFVGGQNLVNSSILQICPEPIVKEWSELWENPKKMARK